MKLLDLPIKSLPFTSSVTIGKFKSLGINTYFDLINYFPYRYENYSLLTTIDKIQLGETVTVRGKIVEAKNLYLRGGLKIQKVIVDDETGKIEINWFNQPYLIKLFKNGEMISVSGLVKQFGSKVILEPKEYELDDKKIHTGRVVPIYSEKKGLSSRTIREKIFYVLNNSSPLQEYIPSEIISYNNLINENIAYQQIHFPDNFNRIDKARNRLGFDELFNIQLAKNLVKKEWQKEKVGNQFKVKGKNLLSLKKFIDNLPFKLTSDQNKAVKEIIDDLKKAIPMNRFLQGDVGSGKTVVAAVGGYLSFLNGQQCLIMAPTEILANQHYQTLIALFKKYPLKIALITGSSKKFDSRFDILVGTTALLNQKLNFKKVGLVVIDEQHRFGVNQRAQIKEKSINPHLLTMTATPIPRTVALTLYGELDLSYIKEMPLGRLAIKTFLVAREKRDRGYLWMKKQIKQKGAQVFVVCPLIEESESETLKSIKAAKIEFENLKKIFFEFKLALLHGKVKSIEKNQIMADFKNKKTDILVTTPVVEVGIDIPGATIMIIEGGERFGLAQLHQLRGRVGRSNNQSYCFIFTENKNEKVKNRLEFFSKNNSGIKLAEYDLKSRGAGNIFGTEQHGFFSLKIASMGDYELIEKTQKAVEYFISKYDIKNWKALNKKIEKYKITSISQD